MSKIGFRIEDCQSGCLRQADFASCGDKPAIMEFQTLLRKVSVPELLLDLELCRRNIELIVEKAQRSGCRFRPHFKTHQSRMVGQIFRDLGVKAITVSSVQMAGYFADAGWDDISIAFPVNLRELPEINLLASRVHLHLLLEDPGVALQLNNGLTDPVSVWIKVDVGTGRTGIPWHETHHFKELIRVCRNAPHLRLQGILSHAGHSYAARSAAEIESVFRESCDRLKTLQNHLEPEFGHMPLSFGDTPTCSVMDDLSAFDEIRPGNLVFYDLMQTVIGSCDRSRVAVAMACPVVALHPERLEMVVYGGAVHFGKEILDGPEGGYYGSLVATHMTGWDAAEEQGKLVRLSQEHGIVSLRASDMGKYRPGDIATVLPVHSCLTAECMGGYLATSGTRVDHLRGQPLTRRDS